MEKLKRVIFSEGIRYLFFGVLTTGVSWGVYSLWISYVTDSVFWSNTVSWIAAVLFAFVTNKLWVFDSRSWRPAVVLPEFGMFLSARILTGILEIVAVPLLVQIGLRQTIFGIEGMLSKVIVSIAIVLLNYVLSKLLIFRKSKKDGDTT